MNDTRGPEMFARYACAPNQLGYCGPADPAALHDTDRIRAAAPQFSGAWPYLRVLSRLTGIADPLDHRLVESYWLGGGLGAELDPREFTAALLAAIGPGTQWSHLTGDLADEAAANHSFHVFGVYPWSRLLGSGDQPLHVLDSCRISWATVLSCDGTDSEVACRRLTHAGGVLALTDPVRLRVAAGPVTVTPGDLVAVHWGRICDHLTPDRQRTLEHSTLRQLAVTNRRLAADRADQYR
ncbi:DUF6390 family protein [Nocardia sp. alder85J]|uniref:DUF6390 family protein n=1 Tax=Nocardia sp. alder85J TaxID=2862949 RepID=UPI001CD3B422|nr:DUF6390 family protein [Nocardia sp. alder85J]MCX4098091.1 DUF6390 family protein [Nocardia sp. alder85J]